MCSLSRVFRLSQSGPFPSSASRLFCCSSVSFSPLPSNSCHCLLLSCSCLRSFLPLPLPWLGCPRCSKPSRAAVDSCSPVFFVPIAGFFYCTPMWPVPLPTIQIRKGRSAPPKGGSTLSNTQYQKEKKKKRNDMRLCWWVFEPSCATLSVPEAKVDF